MNPERSKKSEITSGVPYIDSEERLEELLKKMDEAISDGDDFFSSIKAIREIDEELFSDLLVDNNFSGADLRGVDFTSTEGLNLDSANFIAADLRETLFSGISLQSVPFNKAELQKADFSRANLAKADFSEARLDEADLQRAILEKAVLEKAVLNGANLCGANLTEVKARGIKLKNAILTNAILTKSDFSSSKTDFEKAKAVRVDLKYANLNAAKLERIDLEFADLRSSNLKDAKLCGANLRGVDFRGGDLDGANLEGANLLSANLKNTVLRNVKIDETTQIEERWRQVIEILNNKSQNVNLNSRIFEEVNLSSATLSDYQLQEAVFIKANLQDANLTGADLTGADLTDAALRDAKLERANLSNSILNGAGLRNAKLTGATLLRASLIGACLSEANLEGAVLFSANLSKAEVNRANLVTAELNNATLTGAQLKSANLRGANLERSNLEGAVFENADLRGANLSGANLKDAQFRGANLDGAILTNANYSEALISNEQVLTTLRAESSNNLGSDDTKVTYRLSSPEPFTFVISAIPDQSKPILNHTYETLAKYLQDKLSRRNTSSSRIDVIYKPVRDYKDATERLRKGDLDMVWLGGVTGFLAQQKVNSIVSIAQRDVDKNFRCVFIANRDSSVGEIIGTNAANWRINIDEEALADDLAPLNTLLGRRFIFGSDRSTSGTIIPIYLLKKAGFQAENLQVSGSIQFSQSHDDTIQRVKSGEFDVGTLNERIWQRYKEEHSKTDVQIPKRVWTSPSFPDYHWVINKRVVQRSIKVFGLEPGLPKIIQDLILNMNPSDSMSKEILTTFRAGKFVEAKNQDYAVYDNILQEVMELLPEEFQKEIGTPAVFE